MKVVYYNEVKNFLNRIPTSVYIIILAGICLYTRLNYFKIISLSESGLPKTQDSYWYLEHANELLQSYKIRLDFNGVFYLGYYGILAVFLLLFKSETSFILVQVIINALSVILVFQIAKITFNKRVAVISGILYICSSDIKFWSTYLLTDSLFITCMLLSVYLWLLYLRLREKKYALIFIATLIYTSILRPTGIISAAFFILYILLRIDYKRLKKRILSKGLLIKVVLALGLITLIIVTYKVIYGSIGMSFYWSLRWLIYENYGLGRVFDIPTDFDHKWEVIKSINYFDNFFISFFANNWKHILFLYLKRFISFWGGIYIWYYHFENLKAAVYYFYKLLPLFIMIIGMILVVYRKIVDETIALFIPIITSVVFCIVFFLDSGWRYRLPSIPFNIMFMAYAIDSCIIYSKIIFMWLYKGAFKNPLKEQT